MHACSYAELRFITSTLNGIVIVFFSVGVATSHFYPPPTPQSILRFAGRLSADTSVCGLPASEATKIDSMVSSKDLNQPQIHIVCFLLTTHL